MNISSQPQYFCNSNSLWKFENSKLFLFSDRREWVESACTYHDVMHLKITEKQAKKKFKINI